MIRIPSVGEEEEEEKRLSCHHHDDGDDKRVIIILQWCVAHCRPCAGFRHHLNHAKRVLQWCVGEGGAVRLTAQQTATAEIEQMMGIHRLHCLDKSCT